MKQLKSTTNTQFFLGLICFVSLLSLMPFMHFHEHVHDHAHCHEHEDTESSNTDEGYPANSDESCPGCVFLNTPVTFHVPPITLVRNYLYIQTLPPTEVSSISFKPTICIQSRAPPTFSN